MTNTPSHSSRREAGIALVTGLILLIVVTLIGLSGARNSTLQERLASNTLDRSLAFHAAEAALRAAEAAISADSSIGQACTPPAQACTVVNAFQDGTNWTSVAGTFKVNSSVATTPQYHIQNLGPGGGSSNLGAGQSANTAQYGGTGGSGGTLQTLQYRVTARSGLPSSSDGRSLVVIRANFIRGQ
ncbi:MAG: pilus assembly PilX family protein [Thauera sp.]